MKKNNIYLILLIVIVFISSINIVLAEDIQVFFNNPPYSNNIDTKLIQLIDSAEKTIEAHFYQVNHPEIIEAFCRAAKRLGSSNVRFITDNHYYEKADYEAGYHKLEAAGIKVARDDQYENGGYGESHNKFCIVDNNFLWTGSFNITENGAAKNHNNAVLINSSSLALRYKQEFERMYEEHYFGTRKKYSTNITTRATFDIKGTLIETAMSPIDKTSDKIVEAVKTADHSIDFAIFAFTDTNIADAIKEKIAQGVVVRGVYDRLQAGSQYSTLSIFQELNIPVIIRKNPHGITHHKFMVIDEGTESDPIVITGSHNWTKGANTKNDENTLIIHNQNVAALFTQEFNKLFGVKNSLLIYEVSFKDSNGDWLEISCINDRNNGQGMDIGGYQIVSDNLIKEIAAGTTIKTGESIAILQGSKTDERYATKGLILQYAAKTAFTGTDEQIKLLNKDNVLIDAVCWADYSGAFSRGEGSDVAEVVEKGGWIGLKEDNCINSSLVKSKDAICRKKKDLDTNSKNDWTIVSSPSIPKHDESSSGNNNGNTTGNETGDTGNTGNTDPEPVVELTPTQKWAKSFLTPMINTALTEYRKAESNYSAVWWMFWSKEPKIRKTAMVKAYAKYVYLDTLMRDISDRKDEKPEDIVNEMIKSKKPLLEEAKKRYKELLDKYNKQGFFARLLGSYPSKADVEEALKEVEGLQAQMDELSKQALKGTYSAKISSSTSLTSVEREKIENKVNSLKTEYMKAYQKYTLSVGKVSAAELERLRKAYMDLYNEYKELNLKLQSDSRR